MKITFRKYVEKQNVSIGKVVKVHKIAHAIFTLFSRHLHSIKVNVASSCGAALRNFPTTASHQQPDTENRQHRLAEVLPYFGTIEQLIGSN